MHTLWATKAPYTLVSRDYVPTPNLLAIVRSGFKAVPPPTKEEAKAAIIHEIATELPEVQRKVGRCVEALKWNMKKSIMRAPPSTRIPNVPPGEFREWTEYFDAMKTKLWVDYNSARRVRSYSAFPISSHLIKSTIQEVNGQNHLIARSDKDSAAVIIDRSIYFEALETLLATMDVTKLNLAEEEMVQASKNWIHSMVEKLVDDRTIPYEVRAWLGYYRTQKLDAPKLKMVFKTHKPLGAWKQAKNGVLYPPARPIVTQHRWLTSGFSKVLTKYLGEILALVRKEHPITILKNSYQFVEELTDRKLVGGPYFAVTGDFDALYTNIPVRTVFTAITFFAEKFDWQLQNWKFLHKSAPSIRSLAPKGIPPIPQPPLRTILDVLLCIVLTLNTFCAPGGTIYSQNNGIAMGLGVAPIIADLVLAYFEVMNEQVFGGKHVFRYLDDLCIIANQGADLPNTIQLLSECYPLKIGWEQPLVRPTPYLDVLLVPGEGGLQCATNFKLSHRAHYLFHASHHPRAQRLSWVRGEAIRYIRLSTQKPLYHQALTRLFLAAFSRGYPVAFLANVWENMGWSRKHEFMRPRKKVPENTVVSFKTTFVSSRAPTYPPPPVGKILLRVVRVPYKNIGTCIDLAQYGSLWGGLSKSRQ